jgi:hypothetical protein
MDKTVILNQFLRIFDNNRIISLPSRGQRQAKPIKISMTTKIISLMAYLKYLLVFLR